VPLLGADGTAATQIRGVPLLVSYAIPDNVVWALDADRAIMVVRSDASVVVDTSVFFTSDRVAVRGTLRVGFGFPHPAAFVKITTA